MFIVNIVREYKVEFSQIFKSNNKCIKFIDKSVKELDKRQPFISKEYITLCCGIFKIDNVFVVVERYEPIDIVYKIRGIFSNETMFWRHDLYATKENYLRIIRIILDHILPEMRTNEDEIRQSFMIEGITKYTFYQEGRGFYNFEYVLTKH